MSDLTPAALLVTGCSDCPFDDDFTARCVHPGATPPCAGGFVLDTQPARTDHCDDPTWTPDGCPLRKSPALVMLRRPA